VYDIQMGSPTALADDELYKSIESLCMQYKRTVYIPSGAFWGADDISKMADFGTLLVSN
jgi:aspartate dehydrogenase